MKEHIHTIIVGGGLSGLTVGHCLRKNNANHRLLILEQEDQVGGAIKTHKDQGYLAEIGPHGFLDNCQESQQILIDTGLDKECVKAPLIEFVRYVYLNHKLNLIPQTPLKIIKAPLIPLHAKLRLLAELWQPALMGEPSVAKWAEHRFGRALLPYLDAVYTGTYAGDFDKLTIDSVMPGVRALEKEYGSVLKAMAIKMWQKRKNKDKKGFKMPAMTSFPDGMTRLPLRLAEDFEIENELRLNCCVRSITLKDNKWIVETKDDHFSADNVVLALPVNSALKFLAQYKPPLSQIPKTWIVSVAFGFPDSVSIPSGFGYLIPEQEKRFTLGSLFSTNMFAQRAPENHIMFETLIGGRRHPEKLKLDDRTLVRKALEDVHDILQISASPSYTKVLRSSSGIPQLEKNYPKLLQWKNDMQLQHKGLYLCGFGWNGIGLNDMMKYGSLTADSILAPSKENQSREEVKGVYF